MSLVQSLCRLDLVQHHLSIRFGRETSNKLSVIKLQKNIFLHWFQRAAKLYKSLLTNCGVQLRLHQRQLRTAAVDRSNGTGFLWPVAPDEFEIFWSVQFGQFVVCSSRCPMESAPLFLAMLWVVVISHWHSRHCGSELPHTLVLCFNPLPPIFWILIGFASISRLVLVRRLGGGQLPPFASPVTTLMT